MRGSRHVTSTDRRAARRRPPGRQRRVPRSYSGYAALHLRDGRELEAHVHDGEDDAFYILEGELTFVLGDDDVAAPPGTFVLVPPGVRHGFRNDSDTPVRILNIHAPAGFDRRIGLRD